VVARAIDGDRAHEDARLARADPTERPPGPCVESEAEHALARRIEGQACAADARRAEAEAARVALRQPGADADYGKSTKWTASRSLCRTTGARGISRRSAKAPPRNHATLALQGAEVTRGPQSLRVRGLRGVRGCGGESGASSTARTPQRADAGQERPLPPGQVIERAQPLPGCQVDERLAVHGRGFGTPA